jgi:hypothetical protein
LPAKSQAQRAYLAANFGIAWMREHHFANKGKLPAKVGKPSKPVKPRKKKPRKKGK